MFCVCVPVCVVLCVCACDLSLTLHTFGQVPEVEDVVGLGRSGQQVHTHAVVDLHGGVHYAAGALLHRHGEVVQEAAQDRLKRWRSEE